MELSNEVLDSLLQFYAARGKLPSGGLQVSSVPSLGALVELLSAADQGLLPLKDIKLPTKHAPLVEALQHARLIGLEPGSQFGVYPLALRFSTDIEQGQWGIWSLRLQAATEAAGFAKTTAQGLVGSIRELACNVDEHSRAPDSGYAVYRVRQQRVELVIADQGIGVLASLRSNPRHSGLRDAGEALGCAIRDGESSLVESGRGYGMSSVFHALAGVNGQVRLRSGDHVLEIEGGSMQGPGKQRIHQRVGVLGLIISITCVANSFHR